MPNRSLMHKIIAISPDIEMTVRRLYWRNVRWLLQVNIHQYVRSNNKSIEHKIDYSNVERVLIANVVTRGSLMLLHSSYAPLKGRGKNANEIINF